MEKFRGGCILIPLLIMIAILPFKLGIDFLESKDKCYRFIPFCESKQEKEERIIEEAESDMYSKVERISKESGNNTLNGVYLYWDGDIDNPQLQL